MEEALRVMECNLRRLVIANADAMIVVDLTGRVQVVTSAAEVILGRRASELAGSQFAFDLIHDQR
jgi:PAS domain S-box-containing protein